MLEAGLPIPSVQNRGEWQVAGVRCEQASIQHNDTAQRSHSGALGVLGFEILEGTVGVGQFVGHWPHLAADGAVRESPELFLTTSVGMRDAQFIGADIVRQRSFIRTRYDGAPAHSTPPPRPEKRGHTLKTLLQILILEAPDGRCSRVHDGYGSLVTDLETH